MILPPALLASLKILSSIIKAKNVLDLELFTQRRSCSKVTKLWLEEVAWRPPPSNWRHSRLSCCCDTELSSFLICKSGEVFKGTCQYRSVEWLDLLCISIFCKEARFTTLRLFLFKTTSYPSIARLTSGRTSIGFLPRAKRYVSFWQFESKWLILAKCRGAAADMF